MQTIAENRLVTKPKLVGASGRQIEFPLGILLNDSHVRAIQTTGVSKEHRMDWNYVSQSLGKLTDLKKASSPHLDNRLVIIEEGAPQDEHNRAVSVLSDVARVLDFQDNDAFIELVAA